MSGTTHPPSTTSDGVLIACYSTWVCVCVFVCWGRQGGLLISSKFNFRVYLAGSFMAPTFTDQGSQETDTEILRFACERFFWGMLSGTTHLRVKGEDWAEGEVELWCNCSALSRSYRELRRWDDRLEIPVIGTRGSGFCLPALASYWMQAAPLEETYLEQGSCGRLRAIPKIRT